MGSNVQVYTGEGKGKTTAAVGLAVRAAGQGLRVVFVQFLKNCESGELRILEGIENIECIYIASCEGFFYQLDSGQKAQLRKNVKHELASLRGCLNTVDLLILDEAMAALSCGILTMDELLQIIDNRGNTEIVLTGRDVPGQIIERAHLVTQMQSIKHYFKQGQCARKGIEY